MTDPDEGDGWSRVDREQWAKMRPYVLDAADLSPEAARGIRDRFRGALGKAVGAFFEAVGRPPTSDEFDALRRALTAHFNEVVIPKAAPLPN